MIRVKIPHHIAWRHCPGVAVAGKSDNFATVKVCLASGTRIREYCEVFERLKQAKIRIGTMDLKIAAIALANDATLLTRNHSG